jgi:hypothetical protein
VHHLAESNSLFPAGDGAESIPLPLYLLGLDVQERWTFAVDISPARDLFMVRHED